MRTSAKHHAIDQRVLRHILLCFSFPFLETHVGMRTCLQCIFQHGKIFMVAAECGCFAFWGCSGGVTVWGSFRIHLGQRNLF